MPVKEHSGGGRAEHHAHVLVEWFEGLPRLGGPALGEQQHPDVVPQLHGLLAHVAVDGPHDVQHALERGQRVGDLAEFGAAAGRLGAAGAGLLAGGPGDTGVGVGEGVELGQGGPVVTAEETDGRSLAAQCQDLLALGAEGEGGGCDDLAEHLSGCRGRPLR